jgi:hypothetical protein
MSTCVLLVAAKNAGEFKDLSFASLRDGRYKV